MKKRNPLIAVLLSMLAPGTGQIYNGELIKGLVVAIGRIIVLFVLGYSGLQTSFYGLLALLAIALCLQLYPMIDALVISIKKKTIELRKSNRVINYLALIVFTFLFHFFVTNTTLLGIKPYVISGPSMEPTLSSNDRVIVNVRTKEFNNGDLVLYKRNNFLYIKRIVASNGETIEMKDNKVMINGKVIDEPYLGDQQRNLPLPLTTVPEDHYFVLGDNRMNSADSRVFGPIAKKDIIGKLEFVFWPRK